jgi:hypothetical protein
VEEVEEAPEHMHDVRCTPRRQRGERETYDELPDVPAGGSLTPGVTRLLLNSASNI